MKFQLNSKGSSGVELTTCGWMVSKERLLQLKKQQQQTPPQMLFFYQHIFHAGFSQSFLVS